MVKQKVVKLSESNCRDVEIEKLKCCGIFEIAELQDEPWEVLYSLCNEIDLDYNMVIFHDAVRYNLGEKLAKTIRKYKLGKLHASKIVYNPNSGNNIQMWIFYPNWEMLRPIISSVKEIDCLEDNDYNCECEICNGDQGLEITLPSNKK